MAVTLDQIVPWGRTFQEYMCMFDLRLTQTVQGVLDCGGGPASFTAELVARGMPAVAVDPLYARPGEEIQSRFDAVEEPMLAQVKSTPNDWVWTYHRDPEHLRKNRRAALEIFLADYEPGRRAGRYRVGELPELPFKEAEFGLAVCSHLLFLYSDLLSEQFHVRATLELCRVAREVRIFPLVTLAREYSPHVAAVCRAARDSGLASEIITVNYELQRGANQMLRIYRP